MPSLRQLKRDHVANRTFHMKNRVDVSDVGYFETAEGIRQYKKSKKGRKYFSTAINQHVRFEWKTDKEFRKLTEGMSFKEKRSVFLRMNAKKFVVNARKPYSKKIAFSSKTGTYV
jgi:hypothetical protein